jgi:hypothetical protein
MIDGNIIKYPITRQEVINYFERLETDLQPIIDRFGWEMIEIYAADHPTVFFI